MSVSEFFSSEPEPPWIVDVAADLESYTDIQAENEEASTSSSPIIMGQSSLSSPSFMSSTSTSVMDMEVDFPAASESRLDKVIAHLFTLREIESVRPFRIEDFKTSSSAVKRARVPEDCEKSIYWSRRIPISNLLLRDHELDTNPRLLTTSIPLLLL
ncbi:hypothetical protein R1flu_006086 [Riccia fluitans]|uniref:Uncharacterized protein n=1 Tax=Riccia fluitans TaxID=41844 RepID=A0ABD1YV16_9MARC